MRRIHTDDIELQMRGIARYELANGQRIDLDARAVAEHGAATILRHYGLTNLLPTERVKVVYCGKEVGTLPADFDPSSVRSKSFLYDPRHGDFRWKDSGVVEVDKSLGPGDLDSVVGFVRNEQSERAPT